MKTFHIRFYENRKIYFAISLLLMGAGLIFNIIFGTQLDIQFTGGALIKYSYSGEINQEKVQDIVQATTSKPVTVSINKDVKSADDGKSLNNVSISFSGTESLTVQQQQAVAAALAKEYPSAKFAVVESSSINPVMGRDFFLKCLLSVFAAALLLIVYIAFRFRKIGGASAGTMAIIALMHDVAMVYFTFVVFRMPINDNFIAVVLTILGYSLNDTIIIYDRIRENRKLMGPKTDYSVLVDTSINQTLTRSLYTAGCTFVAIAVVYAVSVMYNLDSVQTFALPMMVGILTGCYSSICVAGPLYVMWQKHKQQKKQKAAATN